MIISTIFIHLQGIVAEMGLRAVFFATLLCLAAATKSGGQHGHGHQHSFKIFSSLQHNSSHCSDVTIPYPIGAPLTLTCQSRKKNFWMTDATENAPFEQENRLFHFIHIASAKIAELTEEHDGLEMKCAQGEHHKKRVKLNVISTPELSVKSLPDQRKVECRVTKNWKPQLELCWFGGESPECENKHKIVRSLGDETEGSALTCRPRLKNHRMLSSLSDEAKGYFEKMFDKAQKTIDVGLSGIRELQKINSENPGELSPFSQQASEKQPKSDSGETKSFSNKEFSMKIQHNPETNDVIFLKSKKPENPDTYLAASIVVSCILGMLGLTLLLLFGYKYKMWQSSSAVKETKSVCVDFENSRADGKYHKLQSGNDV